MRYKKKGLSMKNIAYNHNICDKFDNKMSKNNKFDH